MREQDAATLTPHANKGNPKAVPNPSPHSTSLQQPCVLNQHGAQHLQHRRPAPGALFHSDRGSQYTSHDFTDLLGEHEMVQSLSRPRQCWDNAVAESFFASLKLECIYRQSWATRTQVRRAVFDYIEVFYNRIRLHSALGYVSPAEFELAQVA